MLEFSTEELIRSPVFPLLRFEKVGVFFAQSLALGDLALSRVGEAKRCEAFTAVWSGYDQWLVLGDYEVPTNACYSNQSSARAIFDIPVDAARRVLPGGTPLSLNEKSLPVGKSVFTWLDHMTVHIWRVEPTRLTLAVPISYGAHLNHWLKEQLTLLERHAL